MYGVSPVLVTSAGVSASESIVGVSFALQSICTLGVQYVIVDAFSWLTASEVQEITKIAFSVIRGIN